MSIRWNPAVEDQAIQRVHRIGQTRKVLVQRFIVRHSIEERIIALQNKKKMLAASLVRMLAQPLATVLELVLTGVCGVRYDMQGMEPEELKKVRLEDLLSLFS